MPKKRILFINQEIAPYLAQTEMGNHGKQLLQKAHSNGYEVRTFMPKFGAVNERRNQLHEVIRLSGMNISINDNDHPLIIKVASLQPSRIQVYFIDNDDYFIKGEDDIDAAGSNRPDNDERALFYARGTMETVKKLRWVPELIQCSGWITAFCPLYMRRMTGEENPFKQSKIIYTVEPGNTPQVIDENVFARLKTDGVITRDIKKFKDYPLDSRFLHLAALEYSHGVIFLTDEPDPVLLERAQALKMPVLTKKEIDANPDAYLEFYKKFEK
ncbi:MAG: glycogen/starch synthase [Bacteroidales bacterium]|nr:glycogen/starch synthase [Bacteroidales bacterium]MBD5209344.1 glycogen/starch synthase [Bacteroidales bacterium]